MIKHSFIDENVMKIVVGRPEYPAPSKLLGLPIAIKEGAGSKSLSIEELNGWMRILWRGREVTKVRGVTHQGCISLEITVPEACYVYGLGERYGEMNRKGKKFTCWNVDQPMHLPLGDPTYMCIPYALVACPKAPCYAILIDYGGYMEIDVCKENKELIKFTAGTKGLIAYLFVADTVRDVLSKYIDLTGKLKLPPKWALGYHQSRYSYLSADEVLSIARRFRELEIPLDAIYLDIDYMDSYKVFTWNPDKFPEPEILSKTLMDLGVRLVTILDVGVKVERGYSVFEEGIKREAFIKSGSDELFVGYVWPGACVFPDFLDDGVRDWWADLIVSNLLSKGVSGVWLDMNEPAIFSINDNVKETALKICECLSLGDTDCIAKLLREAPAKTSTYGYPWLGKQRVRAYHRYKGKSVPHEHVHNIYGALEVIAAYKAFNSFKDNVRSFILSRTGWAGTHSLAAVWTGDNQSCWEHLRSSIPELLSLSLSGFTLIGADVGGFEADTTPELLLRWLQLGAFYPLFRNHSSKGTVRQEPWCFGMKWLNLMREAIRLRYSFLPHIYVSLVKSIRESLPLMRPLMLEFPDDELSFNIENEFLIGDSLLVAPITEPGARARAVYLPRNAWANFWSHTVEGPGWVLANSPLNKIPLYVRSNSAVLTTKAGRSSADPWDPLYVNAFPKPVAEAMLYDDDGETNNYLRGAFFEAVLHIGVKNDLLVIKSRLVRKGYAPSFHEVVVRVISRPRIRVARFNSICKEVEIVNDVPEVVIRTSEIISG